ncbi:hypothetical protein EDB86DRAFT_3024124, partial [Lactarius hatsudake]
MALKSGMFTEFEWVAKEKAMRDASAPWPSMFGRVTNALAPSPVLSYNHPLDMSQPPASSLMAETVQLFTPHGIDVTTQGGIHWFDFLWVTKAKAVEVLIRNGADVNAQDESNSAPLHLASSNHEVDSMQLLILSEADVNRAPGQEKQRYRDTIAFGIVDGDRRICNDLSNIGL